ncbi:MAG: SelB C-terminal domain-containing protein [Candidatus Aminicenantes bacterium]|nr:SelB C-terminal domain-containing protein [Candidatus Aminicenantes bacterium]
MNHATKSAADEMATLLKGKKLLGLSESEIKRSLRLTAEEAAEQAQALEAEGRAVILTFSPLFLLSKESLEFLQAKVLKYLEQHHSHHPEDMGVKLERLQDRFDVPKKAMILALKGLSREGKTRESGDVYSLAAFEAFLSPAEEDQLAELERISLRGELDARAIKDVQLRLHVSPKRMAKLLSILVERKRVVQGKNDFYVHSEWLDGLVAKLRARADAELSVAEFKQLAGLTRKYAIPLLELLDEMGVTRRKGSVRVILRD